MILVKRYKAVMDHLTVDDAMRERVQKQVDAADLRPVFKSRTMMPWRWGTAACIALVLLGGVMVYRAENPQSPQQETDPPGQVTVVSPITTVDTAEALEELVGFPIDTFVELPFVPETVTYMAIQKTTAQTVYQQGEQKAILRKTRGTEDPSGNFNDYEQVVPLHVAHVNGELRGKENSFTDAWWTDGTYAWSLSLSEPATPSEWEALITVLLEHTAEEHS